MKTSPKFVFCATSGFSGSLALYHVFSLCSNVIATLSPYPKMNGRALSLYNNRKYKEIEEIFDKKKYPSIKKVLRGKEQGKKYVEINNLFIQSFAKIACTALKENLAVIHLINNPIEASLQMWANNEIPHESVFRYSANRIEPLFLQYREYQNDFFKAFWFCLESYVRSKDIISQYRSVKHYVFFTKWLNKELEIRSLLESLGCHITRKRMESATKIHSSIEIQRVGKLNNIPVDRDKAFLMAERFINEFGKTTQLTKEECNELILL